MAKGYWIVGINVTDPAAYQTYREQVTGPLSLYGGRFVVRAGAQIVVEGQARPRTVVLEFPSFQAAQDCYHSPEYQAVLALRTKASSADLVIVEGWEEA